jgi:hypothetical protein
MRLPSSSKVAEPPRIHSLLFVCLSYSAFILIHPGDDIRKKIKKTAKTLPGMVSSILSSLSVSVFYMDWKTPQHRSSRSQAAGVLSLVQLLVRLAHKFYL